MNPFAQEDFPVRLAWGPRGARMAAERADILVVVDVLRFSSAVAAAVEAGVSLYPALPEEAALLAERIGGEVAVHSLGPDARARPSLSPAGYRKADSGARIVLTSANGATCARHAGEVYRLIAAGLVNARAVGRAVNTIARREGVGVTVLACGERWEDSSEEGTLRFAVEDYLGAGAVLSHLEMRLAPEAEVCRAAYEASRKNLRGVLWECASGRELRRKGLAEDVDDSAGLDTGDAVPVLVDGCFREYRGLDMGI